MSFSIFDKTKIPILAKALDAYSLRHKAIASNIANIGTDGYRPQKVRFEEELSGAYGPGSPGGGIAQDQSLPEPRIEEAGIDETGTGLVSGTNEVDIDVEMAQLAQNQIRFKYAARLLGESFRGLQKSIRGTL